MTAILISFAIALVLNGALFAIATTPTLPGSRCWCSVRDDTPRELRPVRLNASEDARWQQPENADRARRSARVGGVTLPSETAEKVR